MKTKTTKLLSTLIPIILIASTFYVIVPTAKALVEPGVYTNPVPPGYGFIDFEEGTDGAVISSTIPGLQFTTTLGYDWVYSDARTGSYNVRSLTDPSVNFGNYVVNGYFCAWLGPYMGQGRIDFTMGTASYFSVLTSTYSGVCLDAYDSAGNFLATSGWASGNLYTYTFTRLTVQTPGMAYIIVHDTGNYWEIDDLVTDAPGVPPQAVLYAGGSNPGVVYRYAGGTDWVVISPELGYAVLCLVEYDGHLYAGTMSDVGRVYRYDGGTSWTLVGDNLDYQVCSLAVYQGSLYAGTAWSGMKLYRYEGGTTWTQLIPSPIWSGTRTLLVSHGYLLMGDIGYDRFGRWDGSNFYADLDGGGSCIYDFEEYGEYVYASAWQGRMWRSPDAISWNIVLDFYDGNMWELEGFQGLLCRSYDNGELWASDGTTQGTLVYTASDGIISMTTDGDYLYIGTGGEAGYYGQTEGIANVYQYDGTSVVQISDEDEMVTGVQVLYASYAPPPPIQYYLTVVSPFDTPGGMGWYDEGTTAYATLATGTVDIVPGWVRAVFTGWIGDATGTGLTSDPIFMDGPKTAVANWTIQYYLDVVTDPSDLPPIPGADWYDNCTWVRLTAPAYVPNEAGVGGARYKFSYWDVDGTSQGMGVNPIDIHMNASHIATAYYLLQYLITFNQTGVGSDFTNTVVVIDLAGYGVSALPVSFWYDNGSTHNFAFHSPLVVPPGAKEYHWASTSGLSSLQSGSIIVTGSGSVTGNYVARMHDVAVTNVVANRTWVYQGKSCGFGVNVTVLNKGDFPETVNVTLYYNITANQIIGTQIINLLLAQSQTLVFTWNTTGVEYCHNYTMTAVATIAADYYPADNTLADGKVKVRIMGDVDGNGEVNMFDIRLIAKAFGSYPGDPMWNPDFDLNQSGGIDMFDIRLVAKNFGKCAI